ncbi:hypothetical protein FJ365_04700 [Candidatus Dependentiae bacterium]|nr:hypothetical protein [Candidatus Dependentiae bacterium]
MNQVLLALWLLTIATQGVWCADHLGEYGHDDEYTEAMNVYLAGHRLAGNSSLFQHPRIEIIDVHLMRKSLWDKLIMLLQILDTADTASTAPSNNIKLHVICSVPAKIEAITVERRINEISETFPAITVEDHEARLVHAGLAELLLLVEIQVWDQAAGSYIDMGDAKALDEDLTISQKRARENLEKHAIGAGLEPNRGYGFLFAEKAI